MRKPIRIGTRGSQLALWQAQWVQKTIEQQNPGITVERIIIKTTGDKILDVPLAKVGGKGLFVKEIEEALINGRIDLAVHSMKDMPADLPPGLTISAVPKREAPWDAFIGRNKIQIAELPKDAKIGTSSLRRSSQLRHQRPDLQIVPLRGNLDTRLKKLINENLDGIVLAKAGLKRLGLGRYITATLAPDIMLPAVGQGALCIESRANDMATNAVISDIDHPPTHVAVLAERSFLHRLEGGCQVPIAAHATLSEDVLTLTGLVAELDGSLVVKDTITGSCHQAADIGRKLAENLLNQGAEAILERLSRHV
jgi:hydroxymethylbilane synthase